MSIESWKTLFDWAAVVLVGFTFFVGAGALITGKVLGNRQAEALRQFKLDLATANERAAQADLKRVVLQNRILDIFGPRQLTPEQSMRIKERLAGLEGVKVDVLVIDPGNSFTSSEDSLNLGLAVVEILRSAHIDAAGWRLESCASGVQVANITVVAVGEKIEDHERASQILGALKPELETYSELGDQMPNCKRFSDLDPRNPNRRGHDAKINIAIGTKKQPILTQDMLNPVEGTAKP